MSPPPRRRFSRRSPAAGRAPQPPLTDANDRRGNQP
uniref:Uncharacterized protein n=1 Tax=Siphoviridae sp. ctz7e2 TaxID=2826526 RepID=A0A8S5M434_9CAUD|nr:MAG TPA: hypothetical protein [Siphoviridae sp. ctz7e2]